MKNIGTVMGYTMKDALRRKSFYISNIVIAVIIIVLFNIPNIIGFVSGDSTGSTAESVVTAAVDDNLGEEIQDSADVIFVSNQTAFDPSLLTVFPNSGVVSDGADLEELKTQVTDGSLQALVVVSGDLNGLSFQLYYSGSDSYSQAVETFLKSVQASALLEPKGVESDLISTVLTPLTYETYQIGEDDSGEFMGVQSVLPLICSILLFFAIYFYGYRVSTSISSEKTSRVMETLITSTNPTAIVLGKTFANGILGLLQMAFLILVAVASYLLFLPEDYQIIGVLLGNGTITPLAILVILLYFILGYLVFAMLNAVTGATVSKAEDISGANVPISILAILSFYAAYFSSTMPGSTFNVAASLIPFSAPFCMPGRILTGNATGIEIGASIVLLLLTSAIIAFFSIRIYSALILHYGNRLKVKDLFLLYKNK